jgi:hypothetical protein
MGEIDFQNGFLCGLATKGLVQGTSVAPVIPEYVYPSDWPTVDDVADGYIYLVTSDLFQGELSMYCATINASDYYVVDWGDGTVQELYNGYWARHQYAIGTGTPCSRGYTTFKVKIKAKTSGLKEFRFANEGPSGVNSPVLAMGINSTTIQNCNNMTQPVLCSQLEYFISKNLTSMTGAAFMFVSCYGLKKCILDMPAVTSANRMFNGAVSLPEIDISGMQSLIEAIDMFLVCGGLIKVKAGLLPNLVNASGMFTSCFKLTEIEFDFPSVTNAEKMFANCRGLKHIDLTNMISATNMNRMFQYAYGLKSVILSATQSVSGNNMFEETALEEIDLSNFTGLNIAASMFLKCTTLKKIILPASFPYLSNTYGMFTDCVSLISVEFGNLPTVTYMQDMFVNCSSLSSVIIGHVVNLINVERAFVNCLRLKKVNVGSAPKTQSINNIFSGCYSMTEFTITNLGLTSSTGATTVSNAFQYCYSLKAINLPSAKISTSIVCVGTGGDRYGRLTSLLVNASSTLVGGIDIRYNLITSAQLNAIFTNLPTVTSRTIIITGCTGASGCNRSIATAKGWTVTG